MDADARATAQAGAVLQVPRVNVGGIERVERDRLAPRLELTVTGAMAPASTPSGEVEHVRGLPVCTDRRVTA